MPDIESQVAKIQIGNFRKTNSYVHLVTEKAENGNAELFAVVELPLFNPAAESSCEQIALAIAGSLRRSYKRQSGGSSFENAIAQMNEELGKLASSGQTNWVDKLNCIVAVKEGPGFSIATCGKTAAYLFRNREFTDISTAAPASHPLKTFENIAYGKLKLDDIVILSTTQLFNYISIDRLKNIFEGYNFLHAAQTVIETLKENAGPEVAFATILNLQVPEGQTEDETVDLEDYVAEAPADAGLLRRALDYFKSLFAISTVQRIPKIKLPTVAPKTSAPAVSISSQAGSGWKKITSFVSRARPLAGSALSYPKKLNVETFSGFSRTKKLFFVSLVVLLLAVVADIAVSLHYKKTQHTQAQATVNLKDVGDLLAKAQGLLLYKDEAGARNLLAQAIARMPQSDTVAQSQKESYNALSNQLDDLRGKLEHTVTLQAAAVATLGSGGRLISLPEYFVTQTGSALLSYNKKTGSVEDGKLKSDQQISAATYTTATTAVAYSDKDLFFWNYASGTNTGHFTTSVPALADEAGMAYYPTSNRVYLIDKKAGQIVSFALDGGKISKPVASVKADLSQAQDLTVDGAMYVLMTDGKIAKYQSGKPADFTTSVLFTPLSAAGRIYTQKDFKYLYVLDSGNNRVVVFDKKGNLVEILKNNLFTKLKDFFVDEKTKTLFVLNDNQLIKAALP